MDGDKASLEDSIQLDFDLARVELADARRAARSDDSPAALARVAACRALVDDILDMWNDVLLTSA
jgi:hypothetical protein